MLLLTFGTRPEFLKIKPLINELIKNDFPFKTLFTGQHVDLLENINVDQKIDIKDGENRLDSIISSTMNNINFEGIKYVLVQGDTSSVLGVALSAFHHGKKVIHLEAGLRTYDKHNPYPEETNRRMVSSIADIHLCPTTLSMKNLVDEKTEGYTFVVGNTSLDNLVSWKDKVNTNSNKILITLHRRENHHWMKEWFQMLNVIANTHKDLEFIFPVHPNPNVQLCKQFIEADNIKMIEPLEHNDLIELLAESRLVITDSGGIQEESSFLNKICLTCRKVTERPEAIGQSTILVESPLELPSLFDEYLNKNILDFKSPFGDGHASEKIVKIFKIILDKNG